MLLSIYAYIYASIFFREIVTLLKKMDMVIVQKRRRKKR
jgi:hypothetical protein